MDLEDSQSQSSEVSKMQPQRSRNALEGIYHVNVSKNGKPASRNTHLLESESSHP